MRRKTVAGLATLPAAALASVLVTQAAGVGGDGRGSAIAVLRDTAGKQVGEVELVSDGASVHLSVVASGLPGGFHGFHVHGVGRCEAPFTTAGGHFNPGGANHAEHAGDMPVVYVQKDGRARASFTTDRFGVSELFDEDGSAVIVHAMADNYANIPARYAPAGPDAATLATGDSGGRIACGVIEPESRSRGR
jgi:superoxide dismutase, Cu-Zn family